VRYSSPIRNIFTVQKLRREMKRRQALSGLVAFALALLRIGDGVAQSGTRITVIGLLDAGERLDWWEAFRKQLRQLGYVEGRNVRFEARYAKGNLDALPALAKELAVRKVDVIVTGGAAAAVAARRASRTIPIVMASGTDQVSLGLAESLSRPGGNVTGVSSLNSELVTKRLELLRDIVPNCSRLAVLWHADNSPSMASVRDVEMFATKSRIAFRSVAIRDADELSDAFSTMAREHVDALIVASGPFIYAERKRIAELALKQKLPSIYGASEYAEAGGLVSYAASYPSLFARAAVYVDRILKGANPADMPIEQPTTFELVINEKTARAIGLVIPQSLLARADRVIQ